MSINYSKYINSKTTHYIANSGSDENKEYHGGKAGDQTGHECELRSWYSRPWTVVLRYPDPAVAMLIARLEIAMCLNNNVGYDQYQRYTYWDALVKANYDPSAITTKCEQDCTAGTTANVRAAGYIEGIKPLQDIDKTTRSGNMMPRFVKAGFKALTSSKYLTSPNYLLPGDVLLYENHHAAVNITYGKYADKAEPVDKPLKLGDRVLKNGMNGADVKELQADLIRLGYDCGKWGADGDFGDCTEMAVRRFQTQEDLPVDGRVGAETLAALVKALDDQGKPVESPEYVEIRGGNCYVRDDPTTDSDKRGVVHEGAKLKYAGQKSPDGWLAVVYKDKLGWVSGKYGKLVK
jgi:hypothetical protein